jgi:hypothetical protein
MAVEPGHIERNELQSCERGRIGAADIVGDLVVEKAAPKKKVVSGLGSRRIDIHRARDLGAQT